ncbi:hypothetical protein [Arthrobacter sp. K5]|uniref:Tetratricopeptide repeat protein n=1 Tax=Arthrobacter sp. K5 TaxID=2839623 RepID=A0AAU8EUA7_9MICC
MALIAESPNATALYIHRGAAQFGRGHPAEAITDLNHAASLDPALDTPGRVLANIHQCLGNSHEAFAATRRTDALANP